MSAYSQYVSIDSVDKKAFPAYNFEDDLMDVIWSSKFLNSGSIEGKFYLYFTVDTLGQIRNVNIIRGITEGVDKIIERSLYVMPKWIPAEYKGRKVESIVYLTIRLYLR